jgi:uncharacterized transporter YbjL
MRDHNRFACFLIKVFEIGILSFIGTSVLLAAFAFFMVFYENGIKTVLLVIGGMMAVVAIIAVLQYVLDWAYRRC